MPIKMIVPFDLNETKNQRIDVLLTQFFRDHEALPTLSRTQIQRWIDQGKISIQGQPIDSKSIVPFGTLLEIEIPDSEPLNVVAENIPISILFEDEHLAIVNKPPALTVHPSETQKSGTLVNALLYQIKDLSGVGGVLRPGIVHRIDKNTSGALVISKNDLTHQGLSELFARHEIERTYWAWTYGNANWEGTRIVETQIGRHESDRKKMAVLKEGGRLAKSAFSILGKYQIDGKGPFASWIEAKLATGRTHQIRVHLNYIGLPLLGDPSYGTPTAQSILTKNLPVIVQKAVKKLPGQALHARTLGFVHPITKKWLQVEAPLFSDLEKLQQIILKFQ